MIQLDKSLSANTFAFYPDVEVSSSITELRVSYVQDYNNNSGTFDGTITSKKNWVVGQVSGSELPSPTGQYTLTINELIAGEPLLWGTADIAFGLAETPWGEASAEALGQLLAVERAFLQGDNNPTITRYTSPNETGTYTTYTA